MSYEGVDLLRLRTAHRAKRAGQVFPQLPDSAQKLLPSLIALLPERTFGCLQFTPKRFCHSGERFARGPPPPQYDCQQHRQQDDAQQRKRHAYRGGRG